MAGPDCRSSRCRHRGDCARNPAPPATAADDSERPRCFEPAEAGAPPGRTLGRMAS
ncbi:MAG TPA: hypothetical protein VD860_01180 [Azospirillum sp.]|nr:hypothetical protein [Azospirillum sp.]